ncbi:MAG: CpsD/CapB family tyrosine-protein kinase [Firmicutes bacterium]|nr:CpsD/CapB family tyrosine-protein kinase [Bacillota bacterium]
MVKPGFLNGKREPKDRLITKTHPRSPISEAFRALRTSLRFADISQSMKMILVTSPGPFEGKSTIMSNLAVAMAQAEKRVLAIDADLRKPILHRIFETEQQPGLTNILVGDCPVESGIQSSGMDHLDIIASGPIPPNPSEILGTEATRDIFARLKSMYDYVIVDSPPVMAVTDAVVMSSMVDAVILVMRAGVTRIESAVTARNVIENAKGKILGAVLNEVRHSADGYHYYYYYGRSKGEK